MGVSTGQLSDEDALQAVDLFGNWHEGTLVHVQRHLGYVSESQLATRATSETVDFSSVGKDHGMNVSAGSMDQVVGAHCSHASRNRLIRVAVLVCREARGVRVTQLSASSSAPGIKMAIFKNCYSVSFSASYFFYLHLFESQDKLRLWLVRTAVFVFRHS